MRHLAHLYLLGDDLNLSFICKNNNKVIINNWLLTGRRGGESAVFRRESVLLFLYYRTCH